MRKFRYNFLFVIGLFLMFGTATAVFSQSKQNKNSGILTVKTSPVSYPVKVDGQVIGMSGVGSEAVFYLTPGNHTVEVEGPDGQKFSKTISFVKGQKHCICLKVIENVTKRPCPYDVYVVGPDKVTEGTKVYFKAMNRVASLIPVNYLWSVSPSTVSIVSGLQTDTIEVDTTGLGGQIIRANLDVNDGVYDETCKQTTFAPTEIERLPKEEPPMSYRCDIFESKAFDDDKARFDNCVIELQNRPDAQIYIILYQGTDRRSISADRLSKRTLDYLVRTRGVDPSRIVITKWGNRPKTTVEVWIIPPGAQPPVPQ